MIWRERLHDTLWQVAAGLVVAALLGLFGWFRWDWVVAGFNWLATTKQVPRWALLAGLLLLAMLATTTAVRWWRARSARAFGGWDWRSYTEDMFGGVYWTWKWAEGDEPRVTKLTPRCPSCGQKFLVLGGHGSCIPCQLGRPLDGVQPARMEFERKARAYARGEEG